jgi:hypothetical protein
VLLLEALVALTILGVVVIGALGTIRETLNRERSIQRRERDYQEADRLLAGLVLLNRQDLDLRIGPRVVGEWMVDVERPERTLYRIAVARADAPEIELLVTVVHRTGNR